MHCLVYISSSRGLLSKDDLQDILETSRRNNAERGITGMLIYHDGSFFQELEGPKDVVMERYERILKDERHMQCITLLSEAAEKRVFANWDMAFAQFDDMTDKQQENFINLNSLQGTGKMDEAEASRDVRILIHSFLASFGAALD